MIEALIAAALAGTVTTLVRARRRNKSIEKNEAYDGSNIDATGNTIQGYVEANKKKSSRTIVQNDIEQRIRGIADMKLKQYLNEGRISEDEYRALTGYSYADNADTKGSDAHTGYGIGTIAESRSRKKDSDSMMMQEILLRLERLNYRFDSLEGKIGVNANKIEGSYITPTTPTILAQVQGQEHVHAKQGSSSIVQRERVPRRRRIVIDGRVKGKMKAVESRKGAGGEEDKKDEREGVEVMVIDDASNNSSHDVTKRTVSTGMEGGGGGEASNVYSTEHNNNKNDSNSSNSAMMVGSSNVGYDNNNDELESIKKQIMDVLARLEKDE